MQQQTLSAHFPDPRDMRTIRAAAKKARKSPSAFIRDAALAEAARLRDECPACGRKHKEKRAA